MPVMDGLGGLVLLVIIILLPLISVYLWVRISKFPIRPVWFLLALLGGAGALFIAVLLQSLFPKSGGNFTGGFFFKLFIKIALTEELSRFVILLFFFRLRSFFNKSLAAESLPSPWDWSPGCLPALVFPRWKPPLTDQPIWVSLCSGSLLPRLFTGPAESGMPPQRFYVGGTHSGPQCVSFPRLLSMECTTLWWSVLVSTVFLLFLSP